MSDPAFYFSDNQKRNQAELYTGGGKIFSRLL